MSDRGFRGASPRATRLALGLGVLVGLALLAVAQIPHLQGLYTQWRAEQTAVHYAGAPTTYADEAATYWAWIGQARAGRFFMEDLMTPEDHPRNYVNVFLYALGTIARLGDWSAEEVYASARVVCGALLLIVLALFARALFDGASARLAVLLAFLLASGWEGLLAFIDDIVGGLPHVSSPAWWMPEISTFFSFMIFPHFLAGFAAMIGCVMLLLRAWGAGGSAPAGHSGAWPAVGAGLIMAGITFFHPYDVIPVFAILWLAPLLFALTERRSSIGLWVPSLVASAVWLPSFLYNYGIFLTNPAMRAWDLQNIMETPEPMRLVIAAGPNGVLALVAVLTAGRAILSGARRPRPERRHLVLVAWLIGVLVIIHLPLRFQRRMMGGVQYPLAGLAVVGLTLSIEAARRLLRSGRGATGAGPAATEAGLEAPGAGRRLLLAVLLLLPLQGLTPWYLLDREWRWMTRLSYPAWHETETVQAFDWLRARAEPGARVLASYEVGNLVPAKTGLRVVLGHYALTIDAREKGESIRRFHGSEGDDAFRLEALRRWQVTYVLSTPFERRLGPFDPGTRPWLREVFRAGGTGERRAVVYAVVAPGPT